MATNATADGMAEVDVTELEKAVDEKSAGDQHSGGQSRIRLDVDASEGLCQVCREPGISR